MGEWWRAAGSTPRLARLLQDEHDVPDFFLRHERLLHQFRAFLAARPAVLSDVEPLLLLSPAQVLDSGVTASAEAELAVLPFLAAVSSFVEEAYAAQLASFRSARHMADLSSPQDWFPVARRMRRHWCLHLGPTNSGKTHDAARRLLASGTGLYLSPLRLLAWEMYERMRRAGLRCALRTGQEYIGPEDATHIACTVEMAPVTAKVDIAVLDEVQMIVDDARGAAWTRALLGVPARELHLCGAMEPSGLPDLLRKLALECDDSVSAEAHQRMVPLVVENRPLGSLKQAMAGDCVVCFTRRDVLLVKAELEQLGLAPCVIYGSLPPEVRREQAALFNDPTSGHDVLVASDAVGMGLNLQIRRVVFRTLRKYDGEVVRRLTPAEIRQISGRAGRYGGRYASCGRVTCLSPDDHAVLLEVLGDTCAAAEEAQVVPRAALLPLPERLNAFGQALEADLRRVLPFADMVRRFLAAATVPPHYFLSRARGVLEVAEALEEVRLAPGEKLTFCQAPVAPQDAAAMAALLDFAKTYAASGRAPLPELRLPEPASAVTARHIFDLEGMHKVYDTYQWLARRFPDAFPDAGTAGSMRQTVARRIARALRQPLAAPDEEEHGPAGLEAGLWVAVGGGEASAPLADEAFLPQERPASRRRATA